MRTTLAAFSFVGLLSLVTLAADEAKPPIFNGKDLTGWKTKAGESLDGKTEAFNGRFKVVDGTLVIDPAVKGDVVIETAVPVAGDLKLTFEFKPDAKCNNDLFFRGVKFDIKKDDIKSLKPGEWNTFEIVSAGKQVEFRANGESIRTAAGKSDTAPFGIRAEFGAIEIRKLEVTRGDK